MDNDNTQDKAALYILDSLEYNKEYEESAEGITLTQLLYIITRVQYTRFYPASVDLCLSLVSYWLTKAIMELYKYQELNKK